MQHLQNDSPAVADSAAVGTAPKAVRRVLVTGGAHRLGAEICTAFARAGWAIVCHYHQSETAARALCNALSGSYGCQAEPVQGDLSSREGLEALVNRLQALGMPVHCLVNNASLFAPDEGQSFTQDTALAHWQVNLMAPLALARDVATRLAPPPSDDAVTGQSSVIHVLDQKVFNLNPDYFSYTVSKLALERAVALQAQALAPHVRVCGVAPGLMYLSGDQTPENFAMASRANLLRRPIDPVEVARACVYLAESSAITGAVLQVDNGQHLVPLERDIMFMVDHWAGHNNESKQR
jgi:NAD(P)-dependent dehydrogenase (short-subunit alcohol dehydrogenase family)